MLPFAPEGKMVESLGIAIAAYQYGITLHQEPVAAHHGAVNGRQVQIKTTQDDSVALDSEPEYLIVLRMNKDGTFEECFNGPGAIAWSIVASKPLPKNGEYKLRLTALRSKMKAADLPAEQKIPRATHVETFKRWLA